MPGTLQIDPASPNGLEHYLPDWRGTAVSKEAEDVARGAREVGETFEHSQALFGRKAEVIDELHTTLKECSSNDWDGHGAIAVNPQAVQAAEEFIRALPQDVPVPEVTPEPDGSIGLDWSESSSRVFSVSFGSSPRLAFAWLDGTDRGHGVARFDREVIPKRVLDGIRAIATTS